MSLGAWVQDQVEKCEVEMRVAPPLIFTETSCKHPNVPEVAYTTINVAINKSSKLPSEAVLAPLLIIGIINSGANTRVSTTIFNLNLCRYSLRGGLEKSIPFQET
jgi:hypothetical protein